MADFNLDAQIQIVGITGQQKIAQLAKQVQSYSNALNKIQPPTTLKRALEEEIKLRQQNIKLIDQQNKKLGNTTGATKRQTSAQNQLNKSTKQGVDNITDFADKAGLALRRFTAFTIASTAVFGSLRAISNATKEAIKFERQLLKVTQVTKTLGDSLSDINTLRTNIGELSANFGASAQELVSAARIFSQAGLELKNVQNALTAVAKSSLLPTFNSIEETSEGLVAIYRQFGIQGREFEKVIGQINAVTGKFAIESNDVIKAVQRAGGVFAEASRGVSSGSDAFAEFLAVITSVRATTRESAETIATGLRTIIGRLQRPSNIEFFRTLGVELTNAQGQFIGAFNAIEKIGEAIRNLPERDVRLGQIVERFGGLRQISRAIPLLTRSEERTKALEVAQTGLASVSDDVAQAQQNLSVQFDKTVENFRRLIREITSSPVFLEIAKQALQLANALIEVGRAASNIIPIIATLGAFKIGGALLGSKGLGQFGRRVLTNTPPVQARNKGGGIQKFNDGGSPSTVPGTGNTDSVLAALTPGEYVIRKQAVQFYGADRLALINNMQLPRFNTGGPVGNTKAQNSALGFIQKLFGNRVSSVSADGKTVQVETGGRPLLVRIDDATIKKQQKAAQARGTVAQGAYTPRGGPGNNNSVISVATTGRYKGNQDFEQTIRHEGLHYAKNAGLLNKREISSLKLAAGVGNSGLSEIEEEEAVARLIGNKGKGAIKTGDKATDNLAAATLKKFETGEIFQRDATRTPAQAASNLQKSQQSKEAKRIAARIESGQFQVSEAAPDKKTQRELRAKDKARSKRIRENPPQYNDRKKGFISNISDGRYREGTDVGLNGYRKRGFGGRAGFSKRIASSLGISTRGRSAIGRGLASRVPLAGIGSSIAGLAGRVPGSGALGKAGGFVGGAFSNVFGGPSLAKAGPKILPALGKTAGFLGKAGRFAGSPTGLIAGAIASTAAENLLPDDIGLGKNSGRAAKGLVSGAASGAATGALIGSIIPGVGTGIGAVAGGVIGGATGAFGRVSAANDAAAEAERAKVAERASEALTKFQSSLESGSKTLDQDFLSAITAAKGVTEVNRKKIEDEVGSTEFSTFRAIFSGADAERERIDKNRATINQRVAAENQPAAQAARDFLKQQLIQGGGKLDGSNEAIRTALATAVSDDPSQVEGQRLGPKIADAVQNVVPKLFEEAKLGIKLKEAAEEAANAASRLGTLAINAQKAQDVFGIFQQEVQAASAGRSNIVAAAQGNFTSVSSTAINPLNNVGALNAQDIEGVISSLSDGGVNLSGRQQDALRANAPLQKLDAIIQRAQNQTNTLGGGDDANISSAITKALSEGGELRDIPLSIRESIFDLVPTLENLELAGDNGDEIRNTIRQEVDTTTEGIKNLLDGVNLRSQENIAAAGQRTGLLRQFDGLTQQRIANQNNFQNFRDSVSGRRVDPRETINRGLRDIRRRTGGTIDPTQIGQNIDSLNARRDELLQGGITDSERSEFSAVSSALSNNSTALADLGKNIVGLAEIQQRLAQIEQNRQGARNVIDSAFTRSTEERRQRLRSAAALNAFNQSGGNTEAFRASGFSVADAIQGRKNRADTLRAVGRNEDADALEDRFFKTLGGSFGEDTRQTLALAQNGNALGGRNQTQEAKELLSVAEGGNRLQGDAVKEQQRILGEFIGKFDEQVDSTFANSLKRLQEVQQNLKIPEKIEHEVKHLPIEVNLGGGNIPIEEMGTKLKADLQGYIDAAIDSFTEGQNGGSKGTKPLGGKA